MKKMMIRVATLALAVPGTLGVTDALAFRLIQNTGSGRMTSGARVTCDDPAGYVHWNTSSLSWRLNPAGQGGKAGVAAAVQSAMTSWNNVSPAPYTLNYAGTTNAGFVTDGINSVLWGTGNGCSGSCLALTARPRAGGSVLGFGLSTGGRVKLEVFDVAGRKLATLVDAVETAGNHEIAWDGATAQGRAASGFYFARITTAEGRATATVPLAE